MVFQGKSDAELQETVQEPEPAKEVVEEPVIDIEIVPQQTVQPQIEISTPNNVELQIQVDIEIVPQQTVHR